jgi:hypothetical protein
MTKDIDAEIDHLQNTKDDEEEWGEPIVATKGRQLSAVISVRFSPAELRLIREVANEGNVSNFVRTATLRAVHSVSSTWRFVETRNTSVHEENSYISSAYGFSSSPGVGISFNDWRVPRALPVGKAHH